MCFLSIWPDRMCVCTICLLMTWIFSFSHKSNMICFFFQMLQNNLWNLPWKFSTRCLGSAYFKDVAGCSGYQGQFGKCSARLGNRKNMRVSDAECEQNSPCSVTALGLTLMPWCLVFGCYECASGLANRYEWNNRVRAKHTEMELQPCQPNPAAYLKALLRTQTLGPFFEVANNKFKT